jgi:hypothetical protein
VCSIWWEKPSFYSIEGWPWGGAAVIDGVVVPGTPRGKGWVSGVGDVQARLTRLSVRKTRGYSGGELDRSLQVMAGCRGCLRRLRRSRGPAAMSWRFLELSRVDWR